MPQHCLNKMNFLPCQILCLYNCDIFISSEGRAIEPEERALDPKRKKKNEKQVNIKRNKNECRKQER
ncbi:hypothetical protein Tsubulata_016061 [Turnera subulata]|uniref:Uncharacterized protein n=1 Tax=Turnera subulata TaxID=218843 RepID=A0A9Q0JA22_9ROSI|nr:hypothetical protein Tsubulata_016061 [Turnera subulata]